jgi:hypothetical protein
VVLPYALPTSLAVVSFNCTAQLRRRVQTAARPTCDRNRNALTSPRWADLARQARDEADAPQQNEGGVGAQRPERTRDAGDTGAPHGGGGTQAAARLSDTLRLLLLELELGDRRAQHKVQAHKQVALQPERGVHRLRSRKGRDTVVSIASVSVPRLLPLGFKLEFARSSVPDASSSACAYYLLQYGPSTT